MKKILVVTEIYPSPSTGSSVKTWYLLQELVKLGFKVDVICNHWNKRQKVSNKYITVHSIEDKSNFVTFNKVGSFFSFVPRTIRQLFSPAIGKKIAHLSFKNHYQAVLFDGYSTIQYYKFYYNQNKAKLIYIDDEDWTVLFLQRAQQSKKVFSKCFYYLEYLKSLLFEKKILFFDQVWALTKFNQHRFSRVLKHPEVLFIPTTTNTVSNAFNNQSKDLVFSGTISWDENIKGLKWFVENCWLKILSACPDTKLRITGADWQLVDNSFFSKYPNILIHGYVNDIREIYQQVAVAVSPLFINAGIKYKVLNYLCYGLPVVSTAISAEGLLHKSGIVVAEPAEMASKIIKLLKDAHLRSKYSMKAYNNINKNYSTLKLNAFLSRNL